MGLCAALLIGSAARADSIVPAPDQSGHDAALLERAEGWVRLQQGVLSVPLGFGLEAFVSDPAARATIESFVFSGERDFVAATGQHPYALVDLYEEQGDLGMFGGVQAAGDAFRYVVLRDSAAPAADVDAARAALIRAARGLHWQTQITGVPGVVARGIHRVLPDGSDPPLPGTRPATLPLFDAAGDPQPADKEPTWREDNSGELPFLIWIDDNSKDQIDGYIFALGAIYDAIIDDDSFDRALVDRLVADALAIGRSLMVRRAVSDTAQADLVIMDADGRPTTFHDLSAEEILAGTVLSRPTNGFNAIMSLGMMRTLYHITGDPEIGRFYYEEMNDRRDYLDAAERTVRAVYIGGTQTNYSNINMVFVAIWGLLRFETSAVLRRRILAILEDHLYDAGVDRDARGLGLPFFDFMYAGFRGAFDSEGMTAVAEGTATLSGFPAAPCWNPLVTNCDAAELASLACVADDGTPLPLASTLGRGDAPVAIDPVPMRLRPPSNFEHRSDPHRVNGGGGDRLNPAGSMHAAYWMGRLLEAGLGDLNISPHARAALIPAPRDAGPGGADAGPGGGDGGDCGCHAARGQRSPAFLFLALALLLGRRRG